MSRGRLTTRLAILAVSTALGIAGAGVSGAEAGSAQSEDEPCKNVVLSLLPISLCKVEP